MRPIILKGITQKGNNRINEHGACWNVVEIRDGKLLLEALNTPGYLKWGPEPDFEIVEEFYTKEASLCHN